MDVPKEYFTTELRALVRISDGTVTMEGDAPGDLEFIFYPPDGALEVSVTGSTASLAWEYLFIEDLALSDNAVADRLLAICDGILAGQAISKRSGNPFRRSVETIVPLKTRGLDTVWRDRSTVFFDFGRTARTNRQV